MNEPGLHWKLSAHCPIHQRCFNIETRVFINHGGWNSIRPHSAAAAAAAAAAGIYNSQRHLHHLALIPSGNASRRQSASEAIVSSRPRPRDGAIIGPLHLPIFHRTLIVPDPPRDGAIIAPPIPHLSMGYICSSRSTQRWRHHGPPPIPHLSMGYICSSRAVQRWRHRRAASFSLSFI